MGQLHMHTDSSGDSHTPAEQAARWYAARGFDFIVFTDHNAVTDTPDLEGMLTIAGMEHSQNSMQCHPPPVAGMPCLLHVSALFLDPAIGRYRVPRPASLERSHLYGRAVDQIRAWGGLAMLNHPNFADAVDIDVLMSLTERGLGLIEVENRAVDSANDGRAGRLSTEELWDAALSRGARLFAVATDDAHHYEDAESVRRAGEIAYVGHRGWVMVKAERDASSIRGALERGDFYATTGLVLSAVEAADRRLKVSAVGEGVVFEVIGLGGKVLHRREATDLDWPVPESTTGYVRVRARDAAGRRALCQPLFLDGR